MISDMHEYIVRKWILLRMSAHEFYFKEPFKIAEEYPIMKSILVFAMFPLEIVPIFAYARIYGSLRGYTLMIFLIMLAINIATANLIINRVKAGQIVQNTVSNYEQLDRKNRKRLYSFRNGAEVIFLVVILPWIVCGLAISIICMSVPR